MNVTDAEAKFLKMLKDPKKQSFSMVNMRKAIPLLLKIGYNVQEDIAQKKGRQVLSVVSYLLLVSIECGIM